MLEELMQNIVNVLVWSSKN